MLIITALHAVATLSMVGLIWFVQVVHYPLFQSVTPDAFPAFHRGHMRRTGLVVGPLMLLEAATAVILPLFKSGLVWQLAAWTGLGLLGVVWASTAWLQVPCHRQLARGYDAGSARLLVHTNWIRTAAWSGRGILACLLLVDATS